MDKDGSGVITAKDIGSMMNCSFISEADRAGKSNE